MSKIPPIKKTTPSRPRKKGNPLYGSKNKGGKKGGSFLDALKTAQKLSKKKR